MADDGKGASGSHMLNRHFCPPQVGGCLTVSSRCWIPPPRTGDNRSATFDEMRSARLSSSASMLKLLLILSSSYSHCPGLSERRLAVQSCPKESSDGFDPADLQSNASKTSPVRIWAGVPENQRPANSKTANYDGRQHNLKISCQTLLVHPGISGITRNGYGRGGRTYRLSVRRRNARARAVCSGAKKRLPPCPAPWTITSWTSRPFFLYTSFIS